MTYPVNLRKKDERGRQGHQVEKRRMIHIFFSSIWTGISSGDFHKKNYKRNVIDFLHSTQNLECTGLHRGIPTDHMGQSQGKKEICWDLCSVWELLPHDYKRDSSQLKGSKRCPGGGQGCAQYILVSDELLINNTLKRFQLGSDVRDRLDKNVERERKSHTDKDKVSLKGAEVRSNVASAVSWNWSQSP